MRPGYIIAIVFMLLCGWRAWTLLRNAKPIWRSIGAVSSALAPIPAFLIVVAYHYANIFAKRRGTVSNFSGESVHG